MRQANRRNKVEETRYGMKLSKSLPKGLKAIHIGDSTIPWYIGKEKVMKDRRLHQMIYYGNTEYHLWDDDVRRLRGDMDEWGLFIMNRHSNASDQAKVKVYILTSILDSRENWCFDLKCVPDRKNLKIIYENGTIKNVEFDGEFKPVVIGYHNVKPIGYRIK
jgi:hypothetical protein